MESEETREYGAAYCACPNFVTTDTEYVPFNHIRYANNRITTSASYDFVKSFYGEYVYVLDLMFLMDYIVLNTDRHTGNFGFIRDVNTGNISSYKGNLLEVMTYLEEDFNSTFREKCEGEERLAKLLNLLFERTQSLLKRC